MNRRAFLGHAAAVTFASAVQAADEKPLPIIDAHQHLWDLKKFRLPWIKEGAPLAKSFLPTDYQTAIAGLNVVKSVYMEVDVTVDQQTEEADYVLDLIKKGGTPTVAAVISGRPASEGFAKYVDRYKNEPRIKGVRQVLHVDSTPAGTCTTKEFIRGVRHLGEIGKSYDLCMRPTDLLDAAKLIDECPETRFILDHCGNGPVYAKDRTQWQKDIAEVAKRKNVVGKISGIIVQAMPGKWKADDLAPVINHTLEVFGPDRVMYAGDWPVCTLAATYKQWVEALKQIIANRPAAEQRKLFHDNADKFYRLS